MYRWYQEADICFAYLGDVDLARSAINMDISPSPILWSKWFDRGWTLQELIAPRQLVLFDRAWQYAGTKVFLCDIISERTGIDREILVGGRSLEDCCIAEKFSWAAPRRTTREEDEAYCLLGILDVYMPTHYGEGNRAFRRLQETLLSTMKDYSFLAWNRDFPEYTSPLASRLGDFHRKYAFLKMKKIVIDRIDISLGSGEIKAEITGLPLFFESPEDPNNIMLPLASSFRFVKDKKIKQYIMLHLTKKAEGRQWRRSGVSTAPSGLAQSPEKLSQEDLLTRTIIYIEHIWPPKFSTDLTGGSGGTVPGAGSTGRFGCWFSDLGCRLTFPRSPDWLRHARRHLRDLPPPLPLRCPFACSMQWSTSQEDAQERWMQLLNHIEDAHSDGGICGIRGDSSLLQYLWSRSIIDRYEFQSLTSVADPRTTSPHRQRRIIRRPNLVKPSIGDSPNGANGDEEDKAS